MLSLIFTLGPRGTCRGGLHNNATIYVWLACCLAAGVLGYWLVVVARPQSVTLRYWVALGAGAVFFAIGLVPALSYATCAD